MRPAFKVVSVFDVSQTDGKELPDIAVDELTGSVENYAAFLKLSSRNLPFPFPLRIFPVARRATSPMLRIVSQFKKA